MTIELQNSFQISTPIERAWVFLMSPDNLVSCMPGASLSEHIDDKKFSGVVKLRVGAITVQYAGNITYTTTDEKEHIVTMLAEAKETAGGTVTGTITTRLKALAGDITEAHVSSSFELTGRLVQLARGMIDGVSARLISQFIDNVKTQLEAENSDLPTSQVSHHTRNSRSPKGNDNAINVLALIWDLLTAPLKRFVNRVFHRKH